MIALSCKNKLNCHSLMDLFLSLLLLILLMLLGRDVMLWLHLISFIPRKLRTIAKTMIYFTSARDIWKDLEEHYSQNSGAPYNCTQHNKLYMSYLKERLLLQSSLQRSKLNGINLVE